MKNIFEELDSLYEENELVEGPAGQTAAKKAAWVGLGGQPKGSNISSDLSKINIIIDECALANDPAQNFPEWVVIHHLNGDHTDNSVGNRVITAAHWHNLLEIKMPKIGDPEADIRAAIKRVCQIARKNGMRIFDYDAACAGEVRELVWGGWQEADIVGGGYLKIDFLAEALLKAFKLK